YLYAEAARVREELDAGKTPARRQNPDRLESRAAELEQRLTTRLAVLDTEAQLVAKPPQIVGAALNIPAGMLSAALAAAPEGDLSPGASDEDTPPPSPSPFAADPAVTDRRAVDAALAAERALGRDPEEMPHNNPGYDIR